MTEPEERQKPAPVRNRRAHLANERTFLAWIRTSIAIMAFGFVIERFALFVKNFGLLTGGAAAPAPSSLSSIIGILLVGIGALAGVLAFLRYREVAQQIDEDSFRPSAVLSIMLILTLVILALFLLLSLVHTL